MFRGRPFRNMLSMRRKSPDLLEPREKRRGLAPESWSSASTIFLSEMSWNSLTCARPLATAQ